MVNVRVMKSFVCLQEGNDDKKDKSKDKNKKVLVKTIELPIDARTHGFSLQDVNTYMEQEVML